MNSDLHTAAPGHTGARPSLCRGAPAPIPEVPR